MGNLKRWLDDDAPPEIRRLLRAACIEAPPSRAVERTVLLVGGASALSTATTGALGAVTKAASSSLGWAVAKWGAAAVFGLGLATTTAATVRHYRLRSNPPIAAVSTKSPGTSSPDVAANHAMATRRVANPNNAFPRRLGDSSAGAPEAAHGNAAVVTAEPTLPSSEAPRSPSLQVESTVHREAILALPPAEPARVAADADAFVTAPRPIPVNPAIDPVTDAQLLEEMRLIDRARAEMLKGRPSEALRWLDEYRRACPAQRLMPEAMLLRMRAAARLGDRVAAADIAREIGERYPSSPHAAKAREFLDGATRRSED
jgi:hypothetical protein